MVRFFQQLQHLFLVSCFFSGWLGRAGHGSDRTGQGREGQGRRGQARDKMEREGRLNGWLMVCSSVGPPFVLVFS